MNPPDAAAFLDLPTKIVGAPWLGLVPAAPLVAAAILFAARRRLTSRSASLVAGASGIVGAVAAAATLLAVAPGSDGRTRLALARGPMLLDSGALAVDASISLDAATAVLAFVVTLGLSAAAFVALRRSAPADWARALVLTGGVLLSIAADDFLVSALGWELAALAAWTPGVTGARTTVVARLALASALVGAFLAFWSLGASQRSPEGKLARDVSLARLVGDPAAFEIGLRRGQAVPVGVEEAMRLGDRTASSASWLVAGPTLSRRHLRDLVEVPSTGLGARLEAQRFGETPVLLVVSALLLLAAGLSCVLVPLRVVPKSAHALLPLLGAGLTLRFHFLLDHAPAATGAALLVFSACAAVALLAAIRALRARDARRQPRLVAAAAAAGDAASTIGPAFAALALSLDRSLLEESPARVAAFARRLIHRGRERA